MNELLICLSITDSAGCTDAYCNSYYLLKTGGEIIEVNVIAPVVTGNRFSHSEGWNLSLYPNPAKDAVFVKLNNHPGKAEVKLIDLLGALKYSAEISGQNASIGFGGWASGIYIIEITDGKNIIRRKLMKE